MGQLLAIAIIQAIVVFILTLLSGKRIGRLLKKVSAALILVPILIVFLSGALGILRAEPETATEIADSTIEEIISYFTNRLPGIIISDLAGALVGAVGGFIVRFDREIS